MFWYYLLEELTEQLNLHGGVSRGEVFCSECARDGCFDSMRALSDGSTCVVHCNAVSGLTSVLTAREVGIGLYCELMVPPFRTVYSDVCVYRIPRDMFCGFPVASGRSLGVRCQFFSEVIELKSI